MTEDNKETTDKDVGSVDTDSSLFKSDVKSTDEMDEEAFSALVEYIEAELDFASSHYNENYLKRRLRSRMRRSGCGTLSEYMDYLTKSTDEQEALLSSFSINVTGFFRDTKVWKTIRCILREETSGTDSFRIWSAGCADGREPYSLILLALTDPQIDEQNIEVVATDINTEALEKAKNGYYKHTTTEDIEDQLSFLSGYESHISQEGDRFYVGEEVHNHVTFEEHDLIRDDPKNDFDMVLCRNLMIYIQREYETPVFESIITSMNEDAYLIVGKTETLPKETSEYFSNVDNRLRVYQYDP